MMTAKHFEKLATVIADQVDLAKRAYPGSWGFSGEFLLLEEIASDIADVCECDNPMFDRDRFLESCRVN